MESHKQQQQQQQPLGEHDTVSGAPARGLGLLADAAATHQVQTEPTKVNEIQLGAGNQQQIEIEVIDNHQSNGEQIQQAVDPLPSSSTSGANGNGSRLPLRTQPQGLIPTVNGNGVTGMASVEVQVNVPPQSIQNLGLSRDEEVSAEKLQARHDRPARRPVQGQPQGYNNNNPNAEVNNRFCNSTNIIGQNVYNENQNYEESIYSFDDNRDFSLNETLKNLNKTIQSQNKPRAMVRHNYILKQQTDFRLWMDYFTTELKANKLIDVIDRNVTPEKEYTNEEKIEREAAVRGIIISRLDEFYHSQVIDIKNPHSIILHLINQRKIQSNLTYDTVIQRLWKIRMTKGEKLSVFFDRFEKVYRDFLALEGNQKLNEEVIRSALYNSVVNAVPDIKNYYTNHIIQNNSPMGLEKLKDTLLKMEAEEIEKQAINAPQGDKSQNKNQHQAQQADYQRGNQNHNKTYYNRNNNNSGNNNNDSSSEYFDGPCGNCGIWGHKRNKCRKPKMCKNCGSIEHLVKDCPKPLRYDM